MLTNGCAALVPDMPFSLSLARAKRCAKSVPDSRRRDAGRPYVVVVKSTVVPRTAGEVVASEPAPARRVGDALDDGDVAALASVAWSDMSVNGGFPCPHQQIVEILKVTFDRMDASGRRPWKVRL
jgi:hypothetical protein